MKYEVIEKSTGAKMSHSSSKNVEEIMGTTLFDSIEEALQWMQHNELSASHEVRQLW